LTNVKNNHQIH